MVFIILYVLCVVSRDLFLLTVLICSVHISVRPHPPVVCGKSRCVTNVSPRFTCSSLTPSVISILVPTYKRPRTPSHINGTNLLRCQTVLLSRIQLFVHLMSTRLNVSLIGPPLEKGDQSPCI